MKSSAKVIFFGTSEFAVPILEKLAASRWRPDLAVSTPDAPAGRGLESKPPPVKIAAEKLGIPVIQPEKLEITRPPGFHPGKVGRGNLKLEIGKTDLFIVAAYGKILPAELLKIPKHGSLNIHPSLLPRWRGPSPVQYAILHGDEETGITIILMDEEVDHGPIIKSLKFKVQSSKLTAPELSERLAAMGAELLLETIPDWLDGKVAPQPQDETKATYAPRLKKEDGRIDWSHPAEEIERMVRAFQPWPGAYTFWQRGENQLRLVIEKAEVSPSSAELGPGQGRKMEEGGSWEAGTVAADDGGFGIQTGEGLLGIVRLKPEGKSTMSGEAFRRGHPDILGSHFE